MANVAINEQHLVDIAQAIREKSGIPEGTPIMEISKTPNVTDKETADTNTGYGNGRKLFDTATIPGASTIQVELTIHTESTTYDYLQILPGIVTTEAGFSGATKYGGTKKTTHNLTFENTDTISFYFKSDSSNCSFFGYYAEVTGLDADGKLITDGVPATTFRPCDMAAAIASIVAEGNGEGGASALECIAVTGVNDLSSAIGYSYDLSEFLNEDFIYINWIKATSTSVTDYIQAFMYHANGTTEDVLLGHNSLKITTATAGRARGVFTNGRLELHCYSNSSMVQKTGYIIRGGGRTIGIIPEGELQITKNDTYDVTDYATVVVNVEGSGGDAGGSGSGGNIVVKQIGGTKSSTVKYLFDLSSVKNKPYLVVFHHGQYKTAHGLQWDPTTQTVKSLSNLPYPLNYSSATTMNCAGTMASDGSELVLTSYNGTYVVSTITVIYME